MTDGERLILEAIGRLTDVMTELTQCMRELANPPLWSCGCGHVNPITFPTCAQCGRRPGETR